MLAVDAAENLDAAATSGAAENLDAARIKLDGWTPQDVYVCTCVSVVEE